MAGEVGDLSLCKLARQVTAPRPPAYLFGTKFQYSCNGLNHLLLYGVTCAHHEAEDNVLQIF